MTVRPDRVELFLIGAGLYMAFSYLVLRALLFDTFLWIIVVPIVASLYILAVPPRYLRFRLTTLDWILLLYVLLGMTTILIGVLVLGSDKFVVAKVLVHYYSPVVLYAITRRYTRHSVGNVMNIMRLVWLLAAVYIVDFLVELYVVDTLGLGLNIPWVSSELARRSGVGLETFAKFYGDNVGTFLIGGKRPGFIASVFFVTVLPLLLFTHRRRNEPTWWHHSWLPSTPVVVAILASLGFAMLRLYNMTALLSSFVVLVMGLFLVRSFKIMALAAVLLAIGGIFAYGSVAQIVRIKFITPHPDIQESTPFQLITDPRNIVRTYTEADPYSFLFGQFLIGSDTSRLHDASPESFSVSEIRGVGLPIYFGFGWTLITLAAVALMFRYCVRIVAIQEFKFLGMTFLGLTLVYVLDQHYLSSLDHGPFELFLIMAGALSSLQESVQRPREIVSDQPVDHVPQIPVA